MTGTILNTLKICFTISASPTEEFYSQIAMFKVALDSLGGIYSKADIFLSLADNKIAELPEKWSSFLGNSIKTVWADTDHFKQEGLYAQGENRWKQNYDNYDLIIFSDADTIFLKSIDDLLMKVRNNNSVAGVIAQYPFPHHEEERASDLWQFYSHKFVNKNIPLMYRYSLLNHSKHDDGLSPFYVNFGFVIMTPKVHTDIRKTYLDIRSKIIPILYNPRFSGQIALALAIHKHNIPTQNLDMRYNFPNDPVADALYPEQLKDIAVLHYLRTDRFDRQKIFTTKKAFNEFLSLNLEGSNKVFQEYIRKITQGRYPFEQKFVVLTEIINKVKIFLRNSIKLKANIQLMKSSNLFDASWYIKNNPDVANAKINPYLHYLKYGGFESRDPSLGFNSQFYLDSNPDVKDAGMNPLVHYLKFGKKEKRQPIQVHRQDIFSSQTIKEYREKLPTDIINNFRGDESKPNPNYFPENELTEMLNLMKSTPQYLDINYVANRYKEYGLTVFPDPFSLDIVNHVKQALLAQRPYSVIRIGDGEANLISLNAYPQMPNLSQHVFEQYISRLRDHFQLTPLWKIIIKDLLIGAIAQADIVGVRGMWPTIKEPSVENQYQKFLKDFRSGLGVWSSIDILLKMAENGSLNNKIIGSAHLYFAILENLSEILSLTKTVYLISSSENLSAKLSKKYPRLVIKYISTGNAYTLQMDNSPEFLFYTQSNLPSDMRNSLSLVGAGAWAKIYCSWIKQRGGVAVDLGSGFDLMDGQITRPIHLLLELEKFNKYSLY